LIFVEFHVIWGGQFVSNWKVLNNIHADRDSRPSQKLLFETPFPDPDLCP
jgi:hypothetical protein